MKIEHARQLDNELNWTDAKPGQVVSLEGDYYLVAHGYMEVTQLVNLCSGKRLVPHQDTFVTKVKAKVVINGND